VNLTQTQGISNPSVRPHSVSGDWEAVALSALLLVSAIVLLLAGSNYLVLALAILPFPYLFRRPKAALWYAMAFMPLATGIAPEAYRGFGESTAPQMYYWAAGLFIVLMPVVVQLGRCLRRFGWTGLRRVGVPTSLLVLFGVALAASLQGLRLGDSASYVLRQFYGVFLFCISFVATLFFVWRASEIRLVLARIRWLILALAAYTIILQTQNQNNLGFFKGNISIYSATLAVYCAGEFLCARQRQSRIGWGLLVILFLVHPILLSSRGAVGLAGITMLAGIGLKARSRLTRSLMLAGALLFLAASVAYNLFAGLGIYLERYALLRRLVPTNVIFDPDALGRISQFYAAVQAAWHHPLLGLGLGSTLSWFQPSAGRFLSAALVDNGYAYILSKMGFLGIFAFAWFAISILKRVGWPRQRGLELGLWLTLIFQLTYMIVGTIILHFVYAVWAGVTWGFAYKLHMLASRAEAKPAISLANGVMVR
jgi:O-antigen ligase